jgi:hypothetical protein
MKTALKPLILAVLSLAFTTSFARIGDEEIRNMESSIVVERIGDSDIEVSMPSMVLTFQEVDIKLKFKDAAHPKLQLNNNTINFIVNGVEQKITFDEKGEASLKHRFNESSSIAILCEDMSFHRTVSAYPGWVFIVPVAFLGVWVARSRFSKKENKEENKEKLAA